jgi:hypothetical protein
MQNIDRAFQDMMDLGDKLEAVEEQYLTTNEYRTAYAEWAGDDPTATEEIFRDSAVYENLLTSYGDDLWEEEQE